MQTIDNSAWYPTRRSESSTAPSKLPGSGKDWSRIRGFNYQPSYGTTGLELWQKFDAETIGIELARGKKYFPQINTLRWWQSWDAFLRDPKRYVVNFARSLELAEKIGCTVMPVLFNRWHAPLDYGGIYIDHFLAGSLVHRLTDIDTFLEAIVGAFQGDSRILAWDLCNEPYFYTGALDPGDHMMLECVVDAETTWLSDLHRKCKVLDSQTPMTVGTHAKIPLERMDAFSDVLSIHPYWWVLESKTPFSNRAEYEEQLDTYVNFARKVGKPLIATECCAGSLDDELRAQVICKELSEFKRRNIGWTAYLLHHSMISDAHRPELGPGSPIGNWAFIEADGSLRTAHEVFNEF